ncbi:hypothetical protein [Natranaerobius thermophilus]|uniref:56B-like ribbon-helix-helix domain-containing protein n=1 Tax=Natranaerobius thermophilus (strain ATCC BAA-1301 / DSM 18059 / JW/NM-WN-LF) TaxID=457570 RepID=B2A8N3_NATTJ|nr:hypothetical protein [Natranaerobius thermophilus]ACB86482.1 hypothetical protein Nther_2937 [Natranaerobius thermophilus JW/NM-WN-LF]
MSKRKAINQLLEDSDSNTKIQEYSEEEEGVNNNKTKKKATFELDSDLHTQLKIYAARQNKKMVDVVEEALKEYMKD